MIPYKFKGAASALGVGPQAATVRIAIDSGLVSARSHFKPVRALNRVL